MAVPKRKVSKARRDKRRSSVWKLQLPGMTKCPKCGADIVTFHVEAAQNVAQTIAAIKKAGAKAGLALKPATPVDAVAPFIDGLDMILVMSVEPGFGGQSFMPCALDKIRLARKLAGTRNIRIQVDGGISEKNAASAVQAGADCLVAGSAVFKSHDMAQTIKKLRGV